MATFRTPFWLLVVFVLLLGLFALLRGPQPVAEVTETIGEPTPGPQECAIACGIGSQCDPVSGRCVSVEHTPFPCVPTATFDPEAGFCLPEGAPPPPTIEIDEEDDSPGDSERSITGRERTPRRPAQPQTGQ
jgi:hypothetical protein